MSQGLIITSPSGGAVISDSTANLVFIGKATYSTDWHSTGLADNVWNRRNYWQLTYYIQSATQVMAYVQTIPGTYVGVESISLVSGSTWRVIVGVQGYRYSRDFTPAVYCFAKAPQVSPSGYGLCVYSADGSIQFDSSNGYKYLQTSNIFVGAAPTGLNNTLPTDTGVSTIPGAVPARLATSYSVNAKAKTNNVYCLALSSYSGNTFYTAWFFLSGTGTNNWFTADTIPRVVSIINTDLYD